MEVDQAIKIMERYTNVAGKTMHPDCQAALMLGIEALKVIQADRCGDASLLNRPLPGEIKD